MTPSCSLAEIVEEGEYVIEKWAPEGTVLREVQGVPIRVAVLERLLAVARAAMEMREAMALLVHTPYMENEFEFLDRGIGTETRSGKVLLAVRAALAAFDAAAAGAAKGEG